MPVVCHLNWDVDQYACQPGITDLDFLLLCDKVPTAVKKKKR